MLDGDGSIDAEEMEMQHRIGRYYHISDPKERLAARIAEGRYVYAQDFVWENRDIMWKVNKRWGTMTQRQIIDELISRPNYQGILAKYTSGTIHTPIRESDNEELPRRKQELHADKLKCCSAPSRTYACMPKEN